MDEKKIDQIAEKIVAHRLTTPVIFFLEAHIPLSSVFHTASLAIEPLAVPILGSERINAISNLFSDRKNVELLIQRLEEKEANFRKSK